MITEDFVDNSEILYRRLEANRNLYKIEPDGTIKIFSTAFSARAFKVSVDRAKLCDHNPKYTMENNLGIIACLKTEEVRNIDGIEQNVHGTVKRFEITVEPAPLPENRAHADISAIPNFTEENKNNAYRKLTHRLARLAEQRHYFVFIDS